MPSSRRALRARAAVIAALIGILLSLGAEAAGPKRVLILHSFGRDVAPWDTATSVFRTELARRSPNPITFFEANLDLARTVGPGEELAFLEYLRARFRDARPDVVVTIGAPAARVYLRHRAELFGPTPVVMGALDHRFVQPPSLSDQDAAVVVSIELPLLVENILRVQPDTQTVAIVLGASDLERYWRAELQRELARFAGRVRFEWLNDLSLTQMQERVAQLPPRSAVLYALLIVDAAGVPHERLDALARLHEAANAPIFGLFENELGNGVVGGLLFSQRRHGLKIAIAALHALGAPAPSQPRIDVTGFEPAVYDARELERWRIPKSRLMPDAELRFATPSAWEEHRGAILATVAIVLLQASLITGLLVQRARRRKAEQEARHLGGRILTAQEDERRRLAREMHDDVTQRLAALAIDAARMEGDGSGAVARSAVETIRERLVGLSEDVHALSYRLHPSVIEDLGVVAALRVECNRVALQAPLRVEFEHHDIPARMPPDAAICLFRVAQEALRNVVRHAGARSVHVSLRGQDGGIRLVVRDDGKGLHDAGIEGRKSLGLVSMRERVRLVGGKLDIVGHQGEGTSVEAWVPLREAA